MELLVMQTASTSRISYTFSLLMNTILTFRCLSRIFVCHTYSKDVLSIPYRSFDNNIVIVMIIPTKIMKLLWDKYSSNNDNGHNYINVNTRKLVGPVNVYFKLPDFRLPSCTILLCSHETRFDCIARNTTSLILRNSGSACCLLDV